MAESFDIVIVGAGMAGATLAGALARHGYGVALIESHDMQQGAAPSFDDRAIALSWGGTRILDQLGLWAVLRPVAEPIQTIHVSSRGHFGLTQIRAAEERVPALGYVVTAGELGRVLMDSLNGFSAVQGCHIFCPAQINALNNTGGSVVLDINQQQQRVRLNAKLVIAADGAQSTVRKLLGIGSKEHDYQQNAIIASITPQIDHCGTAYERFTPTGPVALLPMPAYRNMLRCALIWTVPRAHCNDLLRMEEPVFLSALQKQFGWRLGVLRAAGKRASYPLLLVDAETRSAERVVFVGNAAQTLHPVAGQGFNLALRDLAALLDCLLYPETAGDPGDDALLKRYTSIRSGDQRRVIHFTDGLVRLFSNDWPVLAPLRAAALTLLDVVPPLRRGLVQMSMGLQSALPRIQER